MERRWKQRNQGPVSKHLVLSGPREEVLENPSIAFENSTLFLRKPMIEHIKTPPELKKSNVSPK
jgi:hypothetical protein